MKKWMKITIPVVSAALITMAVPVCVYTAPKLLSALNVGIKTEAYNTENTDTDNSDTEKIDVESNGIEKKSKENNNTENGFFAGNSLNSNNADSASEIVTSDMESVASTLKENAAKLATIEMSDKNSDVEISSAGIYLITGSCSDGNITVKKGTTGVVLILKDLDLTSKTGATISVNKGSIVKMIIQGTVTLTDAENPDDENSSDAETADAFDGAVIKVKAGADLYITGTGTLNLNGECKNGIKTNDDPSTVCIIDGPTINITAENDAINSGYDLTILSGTLSITAGDDAIHADRILTIGSEDASPIINIESCKEGLEGTVVNVINGDITVNANDDAINAANSDKTYESEMAYSINFMGGTTVINSNGDGLDSNGNINMISGSLTINCNNNGGEGGIDYNDSYYISEDMELTNDGGITFDSGSQNNFFQGGRMRPDFNNSETDGEGEMPEKPDIENGEKPDFERGERPRMPEGFDPGQRGQRPERSNFTEDGQVPKGFESEQ